MFPILKRIAIIYLLILFGCLNQENNKEILPLDKKNIKWFEEFSGLILPNGICKECGLYILSGGPDLRCYSYMTISPKQINEFYLKNPLEYQKVISSLDKVDFKKYFPDLSVKGTPYFSYSIIPNKTHSKSIRRLINVYSFEKSTIIVCQISEGPPRDDNETPVATKDSIKFIDTVIIK